MKAFLPAAFSLFAAGCATAAAGPDVDAAARYVEEGREAARKGDHPAAIGLYTQAARVHREYPDAYYERGVSNIQLRLARQTEGDARLYEERALGDFSQALRYNPAHPDASFNRAMIYASRAQYKAAVEDLLNASRYKPRDPEPHLWLGDIYEQKFEGRIVAAMTHYEKYVDLGGQDPTAREKVRVWKQMNAQPPPQTPAKAPTSEDEQKARDLHRQAMVQLEGKKQAEAVKTIEELLSRYGHTKYAQDNAIALRALLNAFRKEPPK